MGKKMANAPIYYALTQVRFNPIVALDQYIPSLQNNLRKIGYPDFSKEILVAFQFNVNSGGQPNPNIPAAQQITRYKFLNADRTSGFTLDQNGMSFQTTNYDIFETFLDAVLKGIEILHSEAELSYSERIGIRLLDAVCPKKGEKISLYLNSSILGVFDKLPKRKLVQSLSETLTKQDNATLVSRAIIIEGNGGKVAMPPDLENPLKLAEKFEYISGLYVILDTDAWIENREKLDLKNIEKKFVSLKANIRESFDVMVTPHALKVWG